MLILISLFIIGVTNCSRLMNANYSNAISGKMKDGIRPITEN